MAAEIKSYPESVLVHLANGDAAFGAIRRGTGIKSGSLHSVLRRLIRNGEIHTIEKAGKKLYRIGATLDDTPDRLDFDVDDSRPGPNGGRLIRFGDRWPTRTGQRSTTTRRVGHSSLLFAESR